MVLEKNTESQLDRNKIESADIEKSTIRILESRRAKAAMKYVDIS